jgi:hypothetical protein
MRVYASNVGCGRVETVGVAESEERNENGDAERIAGASTMSNDGQCYAYGE